jgi:hypothetical protein
MTWASLTFCDGQAHPKASVWRKKSFPLYDAIAELVDGAIATGEAKFRPAKVLATVTTAGSSSFRRSLSSDDANIDPKLRTHSLGRVSSEKGGSDVDTSDLEVRAASARALRFTSCNHSG